MTEGTFEIRKEGNLSLLKLGGLVVLLFGALTLARLTSGSELALALGITAAIVAAVFLTELLLIALRRLQKGVFLNHIEFVVKEPELAEPLWKLANEHWRLRANRKPGEVRVDHDAVGHLGAARRAHSNGATLLEDNLLDRLGRPDLHAEFGSNS